MNKSIIPWVGGKAKLMWIINLLAPKYYERSIDVFGGSGTVTLNLDCRKSTLRIYNDFNNDLYNLMYCAKERTAEFLKELMYAPINSRENFEYCKKVIARDESIKINREFQVQIIKTIFDEEQADEIIKLYLLNKDDDILRASAYYQLLRYSFNSNADTFGGKKCNITNFEDDIKLFSRNFSDVTIENKDFEKLIKQYDRPNAFIYCDPPYYNAEDFYAVGFAKENHERLRDTLVKAQGFVMVSYNNSEEIKELYKDFYIFMTTRPHSMSHTEGELYEELIITNYEPSKLSEPRIVQYNLFGEEYGETAGNYELIHTPEKPLKN
ncbi:MAG: DNA adenine methylase [Eubacteriales bacterium]